MRSVIIVVSIAVSASACLSGDRPSPPVNPCPDGGASCSENPYFKFDGPGELAAGADITLRYQANRGLDTYDITSSDPSIVAVDPDVPDRYASNVALRCLAAGTATITARIRGTATVLDTIDLTALDVAAIEVRFRTAPVAAQPIAAIAGVVSTADHLNIDYRSSTGRKLAGHGVFAVTGGDAIAVVAVKDTPGMLSEALEVHDSVGIRFAHLGTATLTIGLRDHDPKVALPIEVVAAPSKLDVVAMVLRNGELVAAGQTIVAAEYVGIDAVGRTGDGRFVAGVAAAWSTTPSVSFLTESTTPTAEVVFHAPPPGPLAVTALVGSLQAMAQLISQ